MKLINVNNLSKKFSNKNYLFKDISLTATSGKILGICGSNGAGKSTLLKLISGLSKINDTNIKINEVVNYSIEGKNLNFDEIHNYISYVAPYYNLYEEFSILELAQLVEKIRSNSDKNTFDTQYKIDYLNQLLSDYNLYNKRNHKIKTFSSGMKQRTKIIIALINNSPFYFFDEYSMNLDQEGINTTTNKIIELKKQEKVVIIATNDNFEKSICDNLLFLN